MISVQRSARISDARATGQYWPYVRIFTVSRCRGHPSVQILSFFQPGGGPMLGCGSTAASEVTIMRENRRRNGSAARRVPLFGFPAATATLAVTASKI